MRVARYLAACSLMLYAPAWVPLQASAQPTSRSKRSPDERVVTIGLYTVDLDGLVQVSDELHRFPTQPKPIHMCIMFGETAQDPAIRLELVSPVVNNKPRGLAISVTEYAKSAQMSSKDRISQHIPYENKLRTTDLPQKLSLTNNQLRDLFLSVGQEELGHGTASSNRVFNLWAENARQRDIDFYDHNLRNFGPSFTFIASLLSNLRYPGVYSALAGVGGPDEEPEGELWYRKQHSKLRPHAASLQERFAPIHYLFYNGTQRDASLQPTPTELRRVYRLQEQGAQTHKGFSLVNIMSRLRGKADGQDRFYEDRFYAPVPVNEPWTRLFVSPTMDDPQGTLGLSTDPRLTSDVLPFDELGSLDDLDLSSPQEQARAFEARQIPDKLIAALEFNHRFRAEAREQRRLWDGDLRSLPPFQRPAGTDLPTHLTYYFPEHWPNMWSERPDRWTLSHGEPLPSVARSAAPVR